jgi:hypothetical protein
MPPKKNGGERVPPKHPDSPLVNTPNRQPDQWLRSGKFLYPRTPDLIYALRWEGKL